MSNSTVGTVYSKIVDDVINLCRAPFEEEGAQASVLDDFKKEWQNKISLRKVAQMPWDPAPAPPTQNPNSVPPVRAPTYTAPPPPAQIYEPKIKTEPGTSHDLANLPTNQPANYANSNTPLAIANASHQIREQFGESGNASLQQLTERAQEASNGSHGQKRPLPAGSPTQETPDSKRLMTDYNSGLQAQAQAKLQQLNANQSRPSAVGGAQVDGAADWKALVAERTAVSADDMRAADQSIVELMRAQWQAEEGNGLMEPVSQAFKSASKAQKSKSASSTRPAGLVQLDGTDDDDEADIKDDPDDDDGDVDAINSDLDDDEEEQVDDDDDDDPQQLIVCTYEKVARVKNKWKCTLKDGILITGGQEYVFAKATGEFEW